LRDRLKHKREALFYCKFEDEIRKSQDIFVPVRYKEKENTEFLKQFNNRFEACDTPCIPANEQNQLLNLCNKEDIKQKIQNLMKEIEVKYTAFNKIANLLFFNRDNEKIVKFLLNGFDDKENEKELIEYVEKETIFYKTPLHYAVNKRNEELVKLLLEGFGKNDHEKSIEYVMKEDFNQNTPLHIAIQGNDQRIIKLLLHSNSFSTQNAKLMDYIMKKYEEDGRLRTKWPFIFQIRIETKTLVCQIFKNTKILSDLQRLLKSFKRQTPQQKNDSSPIVYVFASRSTSQEDYSIIIVEFDENISVEAAKQKIKDEVDSETSGEDWPTFNGANLHLKFQNPLHLLFSALPLQH
jgi:ankyrin repeat protein